MTGTPTEKKTPAKTSKRQTGSQIIKALEDAWAAIRKLNPEVPEVIIITGSGLSGGNSKWAHFWRERWADKMADDNVSDKRPEMFVAGERLACGAELTLQSMLHEAAHAVAYVRDVQDTSRQGRYHNREFVKVANELGLDYMHEGPDKIIGFSAVELTADAKVKYKDLITKLDTAIKVYLDDPLVSLLTGISTGGGSATGGNRIKRGTVKTTTPSRNNVKYVCYCEKPRVMRMAPSTFEIASITCNACDQEFHESV